MPKAPRHPLPDRPQLAEHLLEHVEQLQRQIDDLNAQLQHQQRLATLGTIAGMIAHEFNNILTPVVSYSQMALGSDDPELLQKAVQKAADGSRRAAQIAASILGFVREPTDTARGVATPSEPDPAAVGGQQHEADRLRSLAGPDDQAANVLAILQETFLCMARDPVRDSIRVNIEIPHDCCARIGPVSLQHVLLNVILNSRKAIGTRGGSLEIAATATPHRPVTPPGAVSSLDCSTWNGTDQHPQHNPSPTHARLPDQSENWLTITIRDSGRGIPQDRLQHIFKPFYTHPGTNPRQAHRSHDQHSTQERGTGLGMTMCKRLVEAVGGWLYVESTPGSGTTVAIVLPAARAATASLGATQRDAA